MTMTINAVKLYKLNNIQWVFDDPKRKYLDRWDLLGLDK